MSNLRSSRKGRSSRMKEFTPLTSAKLLEEIIIISNKPRLNGVLLFKHSPRCGVSLHALKQLQKDWVYSSDKVDVYLINVLEHRDISNKVSAIFSVHHESPQILLIKNGECVGNASHWEVSIETVNSWIHA